MDPDNSLIFHHIGLYYQFSKDGERAKKCFLKSLQLDATNEGSGIALSNIYHSEGQHTLAISIYEHAIKLNLKAQWAWERLAWTKLLREQYDDSINNFHGAIKLDKDNAILWEGLASAYFKSGKLTAGKKRCIF
jgi:tetratricopeptide (TPR) repeat protein